MISFIWPFRETMLAGTGGSETFTAGHVRELRRRGIDAQIVLVGAEVKCSQNDFPDLPFLYLNEKNEVSALQGTTIFVNNAYDVPTLHRAAVILHCAVSPISIQFAKKEDLTDRILIATSMHNAREWARQLNIAGSALKLVMPFADPLYAQTQRTTHEKTMNVLYAGRLHPNKGIYTLLEMLHAEGLRKLDINMRIVAAGQHVEEGRVLANMLRDYPYASLLEPRKTVESMADLLAQTDILLMPSVYAEPFGMLSVEAQHSGCRVIASDIGGLPETDCGLLTLVEPRDPKALIEAITETIELGRPTDEERKAASAKFTLGQSVDALLEHIAYYD